MSIEIRHHEAEGRGAFFLEREDARIAEMTYVRAGPGEVVVDHTFVHDQLRGLGVGRKLLDELVGWARRTGTRVRATCPYARAQFDKDPSIHDVWAGP